VLGEPPLTGVDAQNARAKPGTLPEDKAQALPCATEQTIQTKLVEFARIIFLLFFNFLTIFKRFFSFLVKDKSVSGQKNINFFQKKIFRPV